MKKYDLDEEVKKAIRQFPVKEAVPPKTKIAPGEQVIGTAGTFARKAYGCWGSLCLLCDKLNKEVNSSIKTQTELEEYLRQSPKIRALVQKTHELHKARELFWAALEKEFGSKKISGIGIREGWQVITHQQATPKNDEPENIPSDVILVIAGTMDLFKEGVSLGLENLKNLQKMAGSIKKEIDVTAKAMRTEIEETAAAVKDFFKSFKEKGEK